MHLHKGKRIYFSIPCIEEAQKTFMTGIQNHDLMKVLSVFKKAPLLLAKHIILLVFSLQCYIAKLDNLKQS